ncbi:MAG: isochorismatase family protein [Planctomycetota bacterium]|jgi:nicotinamidase-related amidase
MTRKELLKRVPEAGLRKAALASEKAALLVVDMQEHFRAMAEPILGGLVSLIRAFRERGRPVIYTQHGHEDPEKDGGRLGEWWGDLILKGSPDASLLPEIDRRPDETIVPKNRYSAFHGTDLEDRLRRSSISDLVVAGVMTNLCAETTARDAFVRDFRVFFLADGTATASEPLHTASLRNLAFGFAYVVTCKEVAKELRGKPLDHFPGELK